MPQRISLDLGEPHDMLFRAGSRRTDTGSINARRRRATRRQMQSSLRDILTMRLNRSSANCMRVDFT